MTDPVSNVLAARRRLERGNPLAIGLSVFIHLSLAGLAAALPLLNREPPIKVPKSTFIPVMKGGRGDPDAAPPAPVKRPPVTAPPVTEAAAPPAPAIIKPPKEEPRQVMPAPDPPKKVVRATPAPPPPPRQVGRPSPPPARTSASAAGSAGSGRTAAPQGVSLTAPEGAGIPRGTTSDGDFYLASVQRKIWMLWMQQPARLSMQKPALVAFTIQADGSVTDVNVVQSSGNGIIDLAAKRAVLSATPFSPLPRSYGISRITIQGLFELEN